MEFKFTVRGDRITRENENSFVEGNKNSYTAFFDFGRQELWEGVAKLCVIKTGGGEVYRLPIIGNKCTLPMLEKGNFKIGVIGTEVYDGDNVEEGIVISTNMYRCEVESGAANEEANAELNSAAEVWMRYLSDMEENRRAAEEAAKEAKASADTADESAKSALKIADMTVSAEDLPEGSAASVEKTDDGKIIHLSFGIPKGEKGDKGEPGEQGIQGVKGDTGERGKDGADGKDGYTPIKGVDYFTNEDIKKLNIPVVDKELDSNSENAIANKTVTEFVNQSKAPKQVVEFSNGLKLESRDDGVYLIYKIQIPETEEAIEEIMLFAIEGIVYATESEYAIVAENDIDGNYIPSTYATKEKVNEIESIQTDSLTYFGTAIDWLTMKLEDIPPVISDFGDIDIVEDQLIENNTITHYGIVSSSIVVSLPETIEQGFSAALYFATPEIIPENYSTFPADVYFKGDSTDNGAFIPEANMRYTIVFDFDGYMVNAYVSGVSMV